MNLLSVRLQLLLLFNLASSMQIYASAGEQFHRVPQHDTMHRNSLNNRPFSPLDAFRITVHESGTVGSSPGIGSLQHFFPEAFRNVEELESNFPFYNWKNTMVVRHIHIFQKFVRVSVTIGYERDLSFPKKANNSNHYLLVLPIHEAVQAVDMYAFTEQEEFLETKQLFSCTLKELEVSSLHGQPVPPYALYSIKLNPKSYSNRVINIQYTLGRPYQPYPQSISEHEFQRVAFNVFENFISAYETKVQHTIFHVAENITLLMEDMHLRKRLVYNSAKKHWVLGNFQNVAPLEKLKAIKIHLKYGFHLPFFEKVVSNITVTQDTLYFVENYTLFNEAAGLKGKFPVDKIADSDSFAYKNSVFYFIVHLLPIGATNLRLFDRLGYVYNSMLLDLPDKPFEVFRFFFRYPLFGGWRTSWSASFEAPAVNFLTYNSETKVYNLLIPFWYGCMGIFTEEYFMSILLPTGATVVSIKSPVSAKILPVVNSTGWYDILTYSPLVSLKATSFIANSESSDFGAVEIQFLRNNLFWNTVKLLPWLLLFLVSIIIFRLLKKIDLRIISTSEEKKLKATALNRKVAKKLGELVDQLATNFDTIAKPLDNVVLSTRKNSKGNDEAMERWKNFKLDTSQLASSYLSEIPQNPITAKISSLFSEVPIYKQRSTNDQYFESEQANKLKVKTPTTSLLQDFESWKANIFEALHKLYMN